jgi:hypothetical protein
MEAITTAAIIGGTFATANNGKTSDVINKFNSVELLDGRWVCDINSLNEFPLFFEGKNYSTIEVQDTDFKITKL